jgi:Tfp pilus assembly protein PilV
MTMTAGERERGFSLAEVVVALGLLAGVLVSMAGLLVVGNRLVRSGRASSEGLVVARAILEEMDSWSFSRNWEAFSSCDPSAPICTVNSGLDAAAAEWQAQLDRTLVGARALIVVQALGEPPPALRETGALRLTVTVSWIEGTRARRVQLATVRM